MIITEYIVARGDSVDSVTSDNGKVDTILDKITALTDKDIQ